MQKTLSRTIECKNCGCISFPDAKLCPKCGAKYEKSLEVNEYLDITTMSNDTLVSTIDEVNNDVILWSRYQFNCPIHGNISVEASVLSPSIKCPFCHF